MITIETYPALTEPAATTTSSSGTNTTIAGDGAKTSDTPDFAAALIYADELAVVPLEKRTPLLGSWMKQGDLGYLFAPRGAGKSWMAMLIGNAVAEGAALGEWQAGAGPRQVIYFDAEMNMSDVQDRAMKLGICSRNFRWLSNERLFLTCGKGVNIASPAHQEGLSSTLPDGCLFIIDNLSTAQLGMSENDNDSFDTIRDWLLSLRHRGITLMIVHHAGRNGAMRGSSRREDMAHWIISLKDGDDDGVPGVKMFTTTFEPPAGKVRNCQLCEAPALRWVLRQADGRMTAECQTETSHDVLLSHIASGITVATELAEVMGIPLSTISRRAQRLLKAGLIVKNGREYGVVSGDDDGQG